MAGTAREIGERMDAFFAFLNGLGDKVFTEAGLVALLLFWANVYQASQLRAERNKNEALNEKIYALGTASVKQNEAHNHLLDKVAELMNRILNSKGGKPHEHLADTN